jgi:uncharacterized protein (DUF58 family)
MAGRKLLLLAGQAVDGLGLGRHPLRRVGRAQTFREHRPYLPGDDVRHVDWHAVARKDALLVKVFEDEAPIRVELVLDTSGSMAFEDKHERACALATAIGQVALAAGEEVGLSAMGGTEPARRWLTPAMGPGHLAALAEALARSQCAGPAPLGPALTRLSHTLRRRSHIILIGDLLSGTEGLALALHKLVARRHDVTVVQLLHPFERHLPDWGPALWQGLEGEGEIFGEGAAMRPAYTAQLEAHLAQIRQACQKGGAAWILDLGRTPLTHLLGQVLVAQKAKRRRRC